VEGQTGQGSIRLDHDKRVALAIGESIECMFAHCSERLFCL